MTYICYMPNCFQSHIQYTHIHKVTRVKAISALGNC